MTVNQYRNVIRQAFDGKVGPSDLFPGPTSSGRPNTGFSNDPDFTVITTKSARDILDAAQEVAAAVVRRLPELMSCNRDDRCAQEFLGTYGPRLFRRPLADDERTAYLDVYRRAGGAGAFDDALGASVMALLMAPQFLFHLEIGTPTNAPDVVALTAHERASRLSFLLWDAGPDGDLLEAARRGDLDSPGGRRMQAERMLKDPRARTALSHFAREWLWREAELPAPKSKPRYPDYDAQLVAAMGAEFDAFVGEQLVGEASSLTGLFTSRTTDVDRRMAEYYGIEATGLADGQRRSVELPRGARAGILTMPAVMTSHAHAAESSYVFRGSLVVKNVLCTSMGDPPANAQTQGAQLTAGSSLPRDKSAAINGVAVCAGCHRLIDPIGLAFEGYDEIGKPRERTVDGQPIDVSGEVVDASDQGLLGQFAGPTELAERLGRSQQVARCLATQIYKYAYARVPDEGAAETCALDTLTASTDGTPPTPRELFMRLVSSPDFGLRRVGGL